MDVGLAIALAAIPKPPQKEHDMSKCFACDKPMKSRGYIVDTRDNQTAIVGPDCFRLIKAAGDLGYQPPLGGPRLFEVSQQLLESADD